MIFSNRMTLILIAILLALLTKRAVSYPHNMNKRATGGVPHQDDRFMVNQRAQNMDTEAIANASLSSSNGLSQVVNLLESLVSNSQNTSLSSSRVVNLLESLVSNSQNLIVNQRAQTVDTDVIANASVSSSNDLSRVVNLLLLQSQQFKNLSDRVDDVVFSMSVLKKGMRLAAGDCSDIAKQGPYFSGIYKITPWDDLGYEGAFKVYCDFTSDNEEWTVIQRRMDGSVDFFRGWEEYKTGFGDLDGEFWLGLDKLYRLTNKTARVKWQMKVELEDFEGNTAYADYDRFSVADESMHFQLTVGAYSGTAGDPLQYLNNRAFSTKDRDNDGSSSNAASTCKGGWWYNPSCGYTNLNGPYLESAVTNKVAPTWYYWKNAYIALKKTQMKIKPMI